MSIELTEILGNDTIAGSRIILNQNFTKLKDSINTILGFVNIDSQVISGIQKLTITKGDTNISEVLLETNGSGSFGGNLSAVGSISGSSITLSTGATLSSGNLTLSSASSQIINKGDTILSRELVLDDFSTSGMDVSNELYFSNTLGTNNLIYDGNVAIAGWVSALGRSAMVLNWQNFVSSNDAQFYLHRVKLKTLPTTKVGQIVKIVAKINEDLSLPQYGTDAAGYWILFDTLEYTSGNPISVGIKFTKSYQSCELCYDGISWMILNLYGAEVV